MKKKDLLRRIEQLEAQVALLQAERGLRPVAPNPSPWLPGIPNSPIVWCGTTSDSANAA